MTWPAVVAWIIIVVGILPRSPIYLVYIFFGLGAFKSLSLLPERQRRTPSTSMLRRFPRL
jgi:hypothetical protein